jgi:hypothetical protein
MSALPSAGVAQYKPLSQSDGLPIIVADYGSSDIPLQRAVPLPPPPREYYGSWRDEPVEIVHRDDSDLYCSLFIVFFFFLTFLLLIIIVSIEYSDDDYY